MDGWLCLKEGVVCHGASVMSFKLVRFNEVNNPPSPDLVKVTVTEVRLVVSTVRWPTK